MTIIENRAFSYERVVIDDHAFINCTFVGCTFFYGGAEYAFCGDCSYTGCTYFFHGPARRTQELIQAHALTFEGLSQAMVN